MPYVSSHIIASWAVASCIIDISAKERVKAVAFEGADTFAEQTRADEEQEVCHHDEEDSQSCGGGGKN